MQLLKKLKQRKYKLMSISLRQRLKSSISIKRFDIDEMVGA